MSEQHGPVTGGDAGVKAEVVPEVRTQRLVMVNEAGVEQAVLQVHHGMMEVCVGGEQSGVPCQVVIFAGEDEPGTFSAGVELWAKDESGACQPL